MHSREVKIIDLVEEHLQTKEKIRIRGERYVETKNKMIKGEEERSISYLFYEYGSLGPACNDVN